MTGDEHAQRLGRLIRQRRKGLKLTQAAVQAADGPSTATLRLIEGGKHTDLRPGTAEPLERILKWRPGSIAAILKGGVPIEITPAPPPSHHWLDGVPTGDIIEQIRVLFAEVRRRIPTSPADKSQDWPDPFFEGAGDKAPPVRRSEDGDHGNQLGGG